MLSARKIDQILQKAGLGGCTVNPAGAGHYNDSYYLDGKQGGFVLRVAPADDVPKLFYEVDMMRSEVNIHRLVGERTDVPIPKIVYHDFSREVIDTDYLIMEYIEGIPGLFDQRELGRHVRQIHSIGADRYGYPDRMAPTGDNWPDIFHVYVRMILGDCTSCGVIGRNEYEYILSMYDRHRDAVVDVAPHLLHLDLWAQNILTVNGRITALLDFDRGLYGDPELEFAVLDTYGYSSPEFFEGYGTPRPSDANAQIRRRLYMVYELIKYAFIRVARGGSLSTGRSHLVQCKRILEEID